MLLANVKALYKKNKKKVFYFGKLITYTSLRRKQLENVFFSFFSKQ